MIILLFYVSHMYKLEKQIIILTSLVFNLLLSQKVFTSFKFFLFSPDSVKKFIFLHFLVY